MSWNRRIAGTMAGLAVALGGLAATTGTAPTAVAVEQGTAQPGSKGHGKMVFVLTTGLEDVQTVNMAIRNAAGALKSGYLDDAVLLVYSRAVLAFSQGVTAKPPQTAGFIKDAKEAGVRIILCDQALQHFDVPREKLEPGVDAVAPNAMVTLAELVSQGYQVLKY